MNAHQRRIARRLQERVFGTHVGCSFTIPIMALADGDKEIFGCQDCGDSISFADGTAYVTESGDVYCRACGQEADEAQREADAEDRPWDFFYPEPWYDAKSPLSELEPDETPRMRSIGEGSKTADENEETR